MDPGQKLLEHIKTVPNLIDEDPSITTPKNTSFMDLPWAKLSVLLNQHQGEINTDMKSDPTSIPKPGEVDDTVDDSLWDANTGYQFLNTSNTSSPTLMH